MAGFHLLPAGIVGFMATAKEGLRHASGLGFALGLGLGLAGPLAQAAPGDDAAASRLEEVVVTARRRAEALADVPTAITTLDEAGIRARGLTELNQIEKFAPNVVQTNFGQGSTGHAAIFVRGIGLQDHIITTDPAVGIYLDGVYLGRNMGANMDLTNIERVELLRGPQGSLSGRNTLGGALNIVTKKPVGDGRGRIDLKAGSLGRRNANFFADVALTDTLALAVSGGLKSRDGVGRALGIANPEAEVGEIFQGFGRAALAWEASEGLSLTFSADQARSDQGVTPHAVEVFNPDNGFGLRQADQPRDPDDTFSLNNDLMATEDETKGYALTVDWTATPNLHVKAIGARRELWFEAGLDNEKVAATLIEFPERGEAEQTTFELQLSGGTGWGDWVAGLYHFAEEGSNDSPFVFRPGGVGDGRPAVIPASDFDGRLYLWQKARSVAAFAHVHFDLAPAWALAFGARHTQDEKDAIGSLHYFPQPARRKDDWGEATGDVSLTYRTAGGQRAYLSYARGYQAGGYPPRPFGGAATFQAFDPTFADSFEVGFKGAFGTVLTLNAALFHVRYRDLVVQVNELIEAGFLTLSQNAAASRATGIELEGRWRLSSNFDVGFALGHLDIEIAEVDEGVQGIVPGDSPALTPDFTLALSPRYVRPLRNGGAVTVRLDHYHRGEMFGQPINTALNRMPRVDLTNVSATYERGDWSVTLYGHNLGDERYPLAKLDLDPTVLIINSNDRREYGLRLAKRFGG